VKVVDGLLAGVRYLNLYRLIVGFPHCLQMLGLFHRPPSLFGAFSYSGPSHGVFGDLARNEDAAGLITAAVCLLLLQLALLKSKLARLDLELFGLLASEFPLIVHLSLNGGHLT
jgi:hypothetical protein